jgi:hypothetical protein
MNVSFLGASSVDEGGVASPGEPETDDVLAPLSLHAATHRARTTTANGKKNA